MSRAPTLPPIEWTPLRLPPITPLPDVYESNSEAAWASYDAAQQALDQPDHTKEQR